MGILIIAVGLFAGYGTALLASREVRYLTRAGLEEIQILKNRRSLENMVADASADAETVGLLSLVLTVRDFAEEIGFEAGETYTTYSDVGRDTLLLVLSASPKDCLCPHTWKYPIVGRVPYKGFFDPKMAEEERDRLSARGYDTYLRPAAAFSTLGWFNDPLLSTALTRDSVELAATVFHELAHNTLYVKSATAFNESFALFAGYRAAEAFFRSRGDTTRAARAAVRWADEQVLGQFYTELTDQLESFYATRPGPETLDSGRVAIAQWAKERLEGPVGEQLRTMRVSALADRPVNNARLIGASLYRSHLGWFEEWFTRAGSDVKVAVQALRDLTQGAEAEEAFTRLGEALHPTP